VTDPVATVAPGYSAKCRPCNSPHRAAIDAKLLAGEASRAVSSWLAETHGERIPFQALLNHLSSHLDVRTDAAKIVEAVAPVYREAVAAAVAGAHTLDEVAAIGLRVARALEPAISSGKITQPVATAFGAALSNARAAATERHELLHGKKLEVTGVGPSNAQDDVEDLHRRAAAALAAAVGGADPGAVGCPPPAPAG
jgi:hypothetical protein